MKKLELLYIEDDKFDQRVVKRLFREQQLPYQLTFSDSINHAKDLLTKKVFDIIIADYNLHDGTAYDILEAVPQIPTIVVTGSGDEETAAKVLKQGAYDYIIKDSLLNYTQVLPFTLENAIQSFQAKLRLKLLESVVVNANDAIVIAKAVPNMPLRSKVIYANDAYHTLLGYSLADIEGRSPFATIATFNNKELITDIRNKLKEQRPVRIELAMFSKYGNQYWIDMNIVPIFDDECRLTHYVFIYHDITQRKEAEATLIKARDIATEAEQVKEQFLAMMAHEIRTPLNAIVGMSNLLLNTKGLDEEQLEFSTTIKRSADNLVSLINDILDFSKIRAGKIEFEEVRFNIKELIKDILQIIRYKTDEQKVKLVSTYDVNIPGFLLGDSTRLNQILLNLMSNAAKFTEKGKIELSTHLINITPNNLILEFKVKDTGIGISQDKLAKIFERFSQADSSTTRKYGGTGLGLSIVKQLVELQTGEIWVASEVGKGSSFTVTLPFKIADNQAKRANRGLAFNRDLEQKHFLLVEDNVTNQRVACKILEQWNAKISIANNGQEAIDFLKAGVYDLVLLDIQMPVMDGLETIQHIRQDLKLDKKQLPVIALSAAIYEDRNNLLEIGFNEYVTKPFDIDRFYETVRSYLKLTSSTLTEHETQEKQEDMNEEAIIDLSFIRKISNNNKEFIKEMIDIFIQQTEEIMNTLPTLVNHRIWKALHPLMHKFKSSSRNMGSPIMTDICNELEIITKQEPNWEAVEEITEKLLALCEGVLVELFKEVEKLEVVA